MQELANFLHSHPNAMILDCCTGNGNFIDIITSITDSYDAIVGIDQLDIAVSTAQKNLQHKQNISILKMDAYHMSFAERTFDIVILSNSFHHMEHKKELMKEMERVVKPNGYIIINEMIQDTPSKSQQAQIALHHFAAAIDRELGEYHDETYTKNKLLTEIKKLSKGKIIKYWEYQEPNQTEYKEDITWLFNTIDKLVERLNDKTRKEHYQEKALELKKYIKENGFDSATQMIVLLKR